MNIEVPESFSSEVNANEGLVQKQSVKATVLSEDQLEPDHIRERKSLMSTIWNLIVGFISTGLMVSVYSGLYVGFIILTENLLFQIFGSGIMVTLIMGVPALIGSWLLVLKIKGYREAKRVNNNSLKLRSIGSITAILIIAITIIYFILALVIGMSGMTWG